MVAIGLAMDAFAVSVASGAAYNKLHLGHGIRMAVFFGVFQAVMPIVGWLGGELFSEAMSAYDHWIAFGLLTVIGGKMIVEALNLRIFSTKAGDSVQRAVNPAHIK